MSYFVSSPSHASYHSQPVMFAGSHHSTAYDPYLGGGYHGSHGYGGGYAPSYGSHRSRRHYGSHVIFFTPGNRMSADICILVWPPRTSLSPPLPVYWRTDISVLRILSSSPPSVTPPPFRLGRLVWETAGEIHRWAYWYGCR